MRRNERSEDQIRLSRLIIEEIGASKLAKLFGISMPAVTFWKRNGIPPAWMLAIRSMYGNLRAFGGTGVPGISKDLKTA